MTTSQMPPFRPLINRFLQCRPGILSCHGLPSSTVRRVQFNCAVLNPQAVEHREKVGGSGCHGPDRSLSAGGSGVREGSFRDATPEPCPRLPSAWDARHDLHRLPSRPRAAAEIAARRLSPVDLVDEVARIERLEPRLHAFVSVNAANARLAAEAADKAIRAGHAVGPLHGIPIAIKDLVEIEGEVAMGGTAAWRNRVAPHTATRCAS